MIRVLKFFADHPTLGMLGLLISLGLGIFGLDRLQIQLMPDYQVNYATVTAKLDGVSVEGVDEKVARHIDTALNGITGVAKVYTNSADGFAQAYLELDPQSDIDATLDRIEQEIATIPELPSEMDPPTLNRFDASERIGRMLIYGPIEAENLPVIKKVVSDVLRDNDISRFTIFGGDEPRVLVAVNPTVTDELGVTLRQIEQRIEQEISAANSFAVYSDGSTPVVVRNRFPGFSGILDIDLGPQWNGLKIRDISEVRQNPIPQLSRNIFPNGDGLFVEFHRGPNQNIINLTNAIEASKQELRSKLPESVSIQLYGMEAYQIIDRIELLAENGLVGLIFVVLVLYLFVGLQTAVWVGIGLPSAFALSFFLMNLTGQSINMVSVFTMVMVVGILVDDSIVVAEGIISNKTTEEGLRRTWFPVFTATITTVAAFAPILLLTDQIGTYVAAIPWFVCVALMASLIECFVLLPNHLHHDSFTGRLPELPGRGLFRQIYKWFLAKPFKWFLRLVGRIPAFALATVLVFLMGTVAIVATGGVRFQFWLNPQSNFVFAHVTVPSQSDSALLEKTFGSIWVAADQASDHLSIDGESVIQVSFAVVGRHFTRRGSEGHFEKGSILVELKDQEGIRIQPREFLKKWQELLPEQAEGVVVEIEERLQGLEGPPISVSLSGDTLEDVRSASQAMALALRDFSGVRDVRTNLAGRNQEFVYGISPVHKIMGIDTIDVQSGVFDALNGRFGENSLPTGEELQWQVRYEINESLTTALDAVPIKPGDATSLSDFIEVSYERATSQIARRDGNISVEVTAHHDPDVVSLNEIRSRIDDIVIPKISADFDVEFEQEGHVRTQDKTMLQVAMAFLLGIALIYAVLSLTMRSFATPLLILGVLPFGAAGMILGHYLLDYTLTLLSVVALVGLFGVLVNDSILLFDEIQTRKKDVESWRDAVHLGYSHRLRAILLTSITTILGLLPLLLETSYQAQFLVPIAITISFGLGTATVMSFFLVPALIASFFTD